MSSKRRPVRRKHIPMRTCIVCRQSQPKRSLIRIVASSEQGIVADPTGKLVGRGAYVCHTLACWEKLLSDHSSILSQALRAPVTGEEKARLQTYREQHGQDDQ